MCCKDAVFVLLIILAVLFLLDLTHLHLIARAAETILSIPFLNTDLGNGKVTSF